MVKRGRIVAFFLLVILLFSTMGSTVNGIANRINLGLDLQGGFEVLYDVKPIDGQKMTKDTLESAASALEERVNALGVSEPNIQIEGDHRIRVQLAGVKDQNEARDLLSTQANLTFRDVNDKVLLNGSEIEGAKQAYTQNNQPNVVLTLKDPKKFGEITQELSQKAETRENLLVIWLDYEKGKDSYKAESQKQDPKYLSAASVNQKLSQKEVTIEGGFDIKEAQNLAKLINAGALPVQLKEVYSTSVGAQFGQTALETTVYAGIIGIGLVFLFMLAFYRFPGFIACITLAIYVFLILLVYDWMGAVLTLPGIAALVLNVGMAVDANIITYERIKDEIKRGRSIPSAYKAGNRRSIITIFDANITTLLAGAVLFYFGTSSVQGFATMLIVGILISFITCVYGTRLFLGLWVNSRALNKKPRIFGVNPKDIEDLSEDKGNHFPKTKFDKVDFVKHSKKFFTLSIVITIAGIILLSTMKLNLGIDFASGTRVDIQADSALTQQEVTKELAEINMETEDITLSGQNNERATAQFKGALSKDEIAKIKDHFDEKYGTEPSISTVSPTIGRELAKNALYAVLIASLGIVIYVSIRFEWKMALASVIALLHDVFVIITLFSLFQFEVDVTFIAAILTIIGYSLNDTIVSFDRIRENMGIFKPKTDKELADIVNLSLRETFTRSINTIVTVVITVLALLIFGSESIQNFSIALLIGLIIGAYSSLFIASQLWLVWKKKEMKKGPKKSIEKEDTL
ncbi:protein translocase subunit SecDF [Priestia endophytica]|uniref:protein translocase subunit SecDF n=1 Tax=Priestia endophytica TaxID=135735 RepID=UPI00124C0E71|nr:protein translocase subunit SecDF [Priestia endophytica]KAB2495619.1 protein translocase subunit SecDF [Priestia endophytica]